MPGEALRKVLDVFIDLLVDGHRDAGHLNHARAVRNLGPKRRRQVGSELDGKRAGLD